jgi:Domain of unknown function (DUF4062)
MNTLGTFTITNDCFGELMDKRYQVFISSTYTDLVDERRDVIQALMELDCIPAGMELFPAADEEQFSFIKKVIDDCDYYVLIIGGRYGSTTSEGVSYTEKEFDYALERQIPVLAFIHERPGEISVSKSDVEPVLRAKLDAFRAKAKSSRVVKMWEHPKELSGLVSRSISKAIKMYPAIGWVRGNQIASSDILVDLNELRKKNEELQNKLRSNSPQIANIADLDSRVVIGNFAQNGGATRSIAHLQTADPSGVGRTRKPMISDESTTEG